MNFQTVEPYPTDNLENGRDRKGYLDFHPELIPKLANLLRQGLFINEAVKICRVQRESFRRWMIWGSEDFDNQKETIYSFFYSEMEAASAEAEQRSLTAIRSAGDVPAFWGAHAWWLERRFPNKYGKQDRLQLQHTGGMATVTVDLSEALNTPEDRESLANVANVLSSIGIGANKSDGTSDSDNEWESETT